MLRYYFTFLIFLFPALLSAQSTPVSKGVVVEETTGKKYAILIGINDYAHLLKLRFAKKDIEALRDTLYTIGFEKENVYTLTCGGETKNLPTKHNIDIVLGSVLEMAQEGDIVVLAMSGHGIESEGQARFCPIDTQDNNLLTTTISVGGIFEAFEQSKATFKLMLVDACRENPFTSRSVAGASVLQTLTDPPKGVMLLQSCAKDELSYEDAELQHGIFTYSLIEGLNGKAADNDGNVTFLGLTKYATDTTQRRVLDQFRKRQRPYLKGEITDFVLANIAIALPAPLEGYVSPYKDVFMAAEKGNVLDVRYFVEKKGVDVNAKSDMKVTPLFHACMDSNVEVVKYLISQGADVNASIDGVTPLCAAAFSNNINLVKYLVTLGADAKMEGASFFLTWLDTEDRDVEIIKYLISQGADVNAKGDGLWVGTPLEEAKTDEIKRILRAAGARE